jgi:trimeric autotransporter adhesin
MWRECVKLCARALCAMSLGVLALLGTPQHGRFAFVSPAMAALTAAQQTQITTAINTKNTATLTTTVNSLLSSDPADAAAIINYAVTHDTAAAATIATSAIAALEALTPGKLTLAQAEADIVQTVVQTEAAVPSTASSLNTTLTGAIGTLVSGNPSQAGAITAAAAANDTSLATTITGAAIAALQAQVTAGHLTLAQAEIYIIQTVVQTEAAVPSTTASLNTTLTGTIGTLVTGNLSQASAIVTTAVANDPSLAAALINAAVLADKSNAVAVATAGITALQALPGGLTAAQAAGLIAQTVVAVEASVPSTATSLNATLTNAINTLMSNNPSLAGAIVGSVAASDPSLAASITNTAIASLQAQITSGKLTAAQGVTDIAQTIAQVEAAAPSTATALNTTLTNLITTLVTANPSLAATIANDAAVNDPSFTVNIAAAAVAALQALITPNGGAGHLTLLQAETLVTQTIVQVVSTDPSHQSQLNTLEINFINTEVLANPTQASTIATTGVDGYPSLAPTIINTAAQAAFSKGYDPVAVTLAGVAAIEALITYSGPVPAGRLSLAQAQAIITQTLVQVEGSLKLTAAQVAALKNTNVDNDEIVNNQFVSPH